MFAVNLVASAVVVALIRIHVPPSVPQAVRVPDLLGVAAGVVTLGSLTFALIEGGNVGWGEPVVILAAVVAVAAGALFVRLQRTGDEPLLPRRLFAQREVSIVAVLGLLFNFTAYAQMFVLALYFQREWGYTPLQNALMFLPAAFATLVTAIFVGRLAARVGPRPLLARRHGRQRAGPGHPHVQRGRRRRRRRAGRAVRGGHRGRPGGAGAQHRHRGELARRTSSGWAPRCSTRCARSAASSGSRSSAR